MADIASDKSVAFKIAGLDIAAVKDVSEHGYGDQFSKAPQDQQDAYLVTGYKQGASSIEGNVARNAINGVPKLQPPSTGDGGNFALGNYQTTKEILDRPSSLIPAFQPDAVYTPDGLFFASSPASPPGPEPRTSTVETGSPSSATPGGPIGVIGPRTQPAVPFLSPAQQNPLGGGMGGWSASTDVPYVRRSNTVVPPTSDPFPGPTPPPFSAGMAIPGAGGAISIGGPSGPTPFIPPA